ncbi:sperm-associated antigen 7 homolog isoform X1 [Hydra vulgaris]|uniref:Sperm-associated antigen 7 n=1 Tax=Hydra vulgaris TaxID=6087 RepID=T2MIP5_HYDVU|nr:sperm-associated antigen 7 homolog [Hydra vulgaris]
MDLLGSILGSMDTVTNKKVDNEAKKRIQDAKQKALKFKEEERKKKAKFREEIELRINTFIQGPTNVKKLVFEPMNATLRSIVHDVAEVAGLLSYSFGEEDFDRHLVVWKKEYSPSDVELEALRNGLEYNEEIAVKLIDSQNSKSTLSGDEQVSRKRQNVTAEPEKYFEKYAKIVGEDSGLNAAVATKSNKAYGMVPSKNKEDKRSIEETMRQIRDRKLQKLSNAELT